MLSQQNRLRKKEDFENVYKRGSFASFGNITLKFVDNGQGFSRIGFVVSVKFSKKATERNRIKRQLRALFWEKLDFLKKGIDVVVMPRKEEKTTPVSFRESVEKALKKAKLIV